LAGNVQLTKDPVTLIHSHITRSVVRNIKKKLSLFDWDFDAYGNVNIGDDDEGRMNKCIIEAGIKKLIEKGNVYGAFKGRQGMNFRYVLFGDGVVLPTWDVKKKCTVARIVSIDDVAIDSNATDIRNASDGKNLNHFGIFYNFADYDEAVETFPKLKDVKLKWGEFPTKEELKNLQQSDEQYAQEDSDNKKKGQVFLEVDVNNESITYWAGASMTMIDEIKGKDYIYRDEDGEAINPIARFFFSERSNGFYNDGIGHLLSERTNLDTEVKNETIRGVKENANPLKVLNVEEGKENTVLDYVAEASADRAEGLSGIITNPIGKDGKGVINGTIQNLSEARADTTSMQVIDSMIEDDIINMGTNRKDVSSNPNKTASAVTQDNISGNESIADASRQNAQEYEVLLQTMLSMNLKMISEDDKRKLKLKEKIGEYEVKDITLGDFVELAKKADIKINVLETTGVMPDTVVEIEKGMRLIELVGSVAPQSKVSAKVLSDTLGKYGIDIAPEDIFTPVGQEEEAPLEQQLLSQANENIPSIA
ncbi:MAG: hypothetical protein U9R15_04820, partial [Chloroflexota bacterium]|nr:hypothetical protein [Chloroflexota bacterium]